LSGGLERVTRLIGDDKEMVAFTSNNPIRRYLGIFPWTRKSYEFVLRLALVYPIVTLMLTWVRWGGEGRLGALLILPEVSYWRRWLYV
jgi:hypothetical protein